MAKCGLSNCRVAVGPGLRVCVAWRSAALILRLAGGNKSNRAADIAKIRLWKGIGLMIETFIRFDAAEYIRTDEDIAAYLDAIAACGDPAVGA
jgi:hypothetical protein